MVLLIYKHLCLFLILYIEYEMNASFPENSTCYNRPKGLKLGLYIKGKGGYTLWHSLFLTLVYPVVLVPELVRLVLFLKEMVSS